MNCDTGAGRKSLLVWGGSGEQLYKQYKGSDISLKGSVFWCDHGLPFQWV